MKVSETLKAAITNSGLTHYAIAKAAGINPNQLGYFVTGERSMTLETVDKVATALDLELVARKRTSMK